MAKPLWSGHLLARLAHQAEKDGEYERADEFIAALEGFISDGRLDKVYMLDAVEQLAKVAMSTADTPDKQRVLDDAIRRATGMTENLYCVPAWMYKRVCELAGQVRDYRTAMLALGYTIDLLREAHLYRLWR